MSKVPFTAGRVSSFTCPSDKQQAFLWDSKTPGLGLRVTQGAKSYIYQGKLNGQSIRMTIGDIKTWTIGKAQEEARTLQKVIDQGRDPRQQKAELTAQDEAAREQEKVEAMRNAILTLTVWDEYIAQNEGGWGLHHINDHRKVSRPGGQAKKRGPGLTVQGALYPLLQMRMVDITAEVLTDWQRQEAQCRPNSARHAFVLFRAFWRWCGQHKTYNTLIDLRVIENNELRKQIPKQKSKLNDVLQRAQLCAWFDAVRSLNNPVISAYLQGLLLTGARREELAELNWVDVDFKWNSLWIKDKVEEGGRMIPLPPYLFMLIAALPRRNQWVFSSPSSADGKLAEPRKAHNQALVVAGLDHVSLHGLRRTFASLAEWVEMPVGVVAQIMGHAPNATAERHYINRPLELLATWHRKYEAWILAESGVEFTYPDNMQVLRVVK